MSHTEPHTCPCGARVDVRICDRRHGYSAAFHDAEGRQTMVCQCGQPLFRLFTQGQLRPAATTRSPTEMIELGYTYTDTLTGFTGIATGHVRYITGCNQVLVQPRASGDLTKLPEPEWIDEQRLVLADAERIEIDNGDDPGFGPEAPKR